MLKRKLVRDVNLEKMSVVLQMLLMTSQTIGCSYGIKPIKLKYI